MGFDEATVAAGDPHGRPQRVQAPPGAARREDHAPRLRPRPPPAHHEPVSAELTSASGDRPNARFKARAASIVRSYPPAEAGVFSLVCSTLLDEYVQNTTGGMRWLRARQRCTPRKGDGCPPAVLGAWPVNRVFREQTRVVIERSGIPVAALIPTEERERFERIEVNEPSASARSKRPVGHSVTCRPESWSARGDACDCGVRAREDARKSPRRRSA